MIYETTRVQQNQSLTPQISEDYGKTTAQAKSLGMDDGQTVGFDGKTETAASQTEQAAFENPLLKGKEEKNTENQQEKVGAEKRDGFTGKVPNCQCETCRKRRYQDDSNDNGVSCQMPTKMNPTAASYKVKAHEMEHVRREQMKAKEDDRKVISQSVRIMTDRCEECGATYVSGGYTRTITRADYSDLQQLIAPYDTAIEDEIGRA